jgi:hypothetical protein
MTREEGQAMTGSPGGTQATVARDLTILLLDPERGKYPSNQHPDILYSGALLLDLLDQGRIRISGEGKQAKIDVIDSAPVGDPMLDDELKALKMGIGGRKLTGAMGRASMIMMVRALATAGWVDIEKTRRLGLITVTHYHPLPVTGRDALVDQVRRVLTGEHVPERRAGLLAAMLGRDQRRWIPKEHRREAPQRVHAFVQSDAVTEDEREVLSAMTSVIVSKNDDSGRI